MAISLSAGVICEDSQERYVKYSDALEMSIERDDSYDSKFNCKQAIKYVERALSSCGRNWYLRDLALADRKRFIKTLDSL